MLEEIAGIPAEVDYGSEFRYRSPLMDPKSVLLMVSQSGETADTLAATEIARAKKAKILSICNVIDSSIPRKSHGVLIHACRTGDQRGQHQSFHHSIDGVVSFGGGIGPAQRQAQAGGCAKIATRFDVFCRAGWTKLWSWKIKSKS